MVGSAIIRKLLSLGYSNLLGSYHSRMPDAAFFTSSLGAQKPAGLCLIQADLLRPDAVERLFKAERPKYVFLAAAKVGGIHANNTFPAQFIYDNLVIQNNIIHAAYEAAWIVCFFWVLPASILSWPPSP